MRVKHEQTTPYRGVCQQLLDPRNLPPLRRSGDKRRCGEEHEMEERNPASWETGQKRRQQRFCGTRFRTRRFAFFLLWRVSGRFCFPGPMRLGRVATCVCLLGRNALFRSLFCAAGSPRGVDSHQFPPSSGASRTGRDAQETLVLQIGGGLSLSFFWSLFYTQTQSSN